MGRAYEDRPHDINLQPLKNLSDFVLPTKYLGWEKKEYDRKIKF